MTRHLIFFDGKCGLCDRVVQFVLQHDDQQIFAFAPLQGKTAREWLPQLSDRERQEDSVILVENFRTENPTLFTMSQAAFRILWRLGGPWRLLGWMKILPTWMTSWAYRIVARNRKFFFVSKESPRPDQMQNGRFLP